MGQLTGASDQDAVDPDVHQLFSQSTTHWLGKIMTTETDACKTFFQLLQSQLQTFHMHADISQCLLPIY